MTERVVVDVAVVGGGLGGLSAARHLQEKGLSVAVLEGHSKPGGYAHFFRKDDFRFEVALQDDDVVALLLEVAGGGESPEPPADDGNVGRESLRHGSAGRSAT